MLGTTSVFEEAVGDFMSSAGRFGFSDFEALLTTGADDRSLILETGSNKVRTYLSIYL